VDRLSQECCFGIASDTARDAHILHMVREGATWRAKERSPKQEAFARKFGIPVHPDCRSGEVSDAIVAVTGEWYDSEKGALTYGVWDPAPSCERVHPTLGADHV
jgi:hypothetical protein